MSKHVEVLRVYKEGEEKFAEVLCETKRWLRPPIKFKATVVLKYREGRMFKWDTTFFLPYWAHNGEELGGDWFTAFERALERWLDKSRARPGKPMERVS